MLIALALALQAQDPIPAGSAAPEPPRPNILIIFTDDQGWADLGTQGATGFATPRLDQLAAEGVRLTHFRVPVAVCTPSRAALLTGRHPMRQGLGRRVIFPYSRHGLPAEEVTLPEILKPVGYRSAIIGKWHLGHAAPEFHPLAQGFDHWFGVPYSNDMDGHHYRHNDFQSPPLPLWRDRKVIEEGPEQRFLTRRFTDEALRWIEHGGAEPWFLYLAHVMPHQPLSASPAFAGQAEAGLYGDVIQEIDASVGRLLDKLEELGQADHTLVLFTSDNGPWRRASAGPLRGKKNTTWEGGHRVPCLIRWPGRLPAGEVWHTPCSTLDLLPTLGTLCGAPRPTRAAPGGEPQPVPLDGNDLSAWWQGGPPLPAVRAFPYYKNERLQAVAWGRWKLHIFRPAGEELPAPLLYALQDEHGAPADVGEEHNLAAEHPEVVASLQAAAQRLQKELGGRL